MKTDQEGVKVSILGKEFVVACPDNEKNALLAAASYLDEKMRAIQDSGKVIGAERCAIMAALNIVHDFLDLQQNSGVSSEMAQKLRFLQTKIEAALHS